jgi:hypothetical protein
MGYQDFSDTTLTELARMTWATAGSHVVCWKEGSGKQARSVRRLKRRCYRTPQKF